MSDQAEHRVGGPALTVSLLGGSVVVAFEAYGVLTAMPAAAAQLGHVELYAWGFTSFMLAQVLAIVLAGRLVDTIGPTIPLGIGVLTFTIGLIVAGVSWSMYLLLLSRFIQGIGGGMMSLSLMVVIAQAYDPNTRAKIMSGFSFCWVLPSFLGPLIAARITERFSWHWVFLGLAPLLVVLALVGIRPMWRLHRARIAPSESTNPVPLWAAFVCALAAGAIQLAGQRLDRAAIILAVVGVIALCVSVPRLMPEGFARISRGLSSTMMTRGLACGSFFGAENFLPVALAAVYGFSLSQAGVFLALGSASWFIGSIIQASPRLRLRRDQIVSFGVGTQVVGFGLVVVAMWWESGWWLVATGYVLAGLGMGLHVTSMSLIIMQLSEPHLLGRHTSSLQLAEGLGAGLITGLAGTIFASLRQVVEGSGVYIPIYILAFALTALAIVTAVRIGPVRNESSAIG